MASAFYKNHYIVAAGRFEQERALWKATATVAWKTNAHSHVHIISVPDIFVTCADAEMAGVRAAEKWIDQVGSQLATQIE